MKKWKCHRLSYNPLETSCISRIERKDEAEFVMSDKIQTITLHGDFQVANNSIGGIVITPMSKTMLVKHSTKSGLEIEAEL